MIALISCRSRKRRDRSPPQKIRLFPRRDRHRRCHFIPSFHCRSVGSGSGSPVGGSRVSSRLAQRMITRRSVEQGTHLASGNNFDGTQWRDRFRGLQ